jgi:hypothetical protein
MGRDSSGDGISLVSNPLLAASKPESISPAEDWATHIAGKETRA